MPKFASRLQLCPIPKTQYLKQQQQQIVSRTAQARQTTTSQLFHELKSTVNKQDESQLWQKDEFEMNFQSYQQIKLSVSTKLDYPQHQYWPQSVDNNTQDIATRLSRRQSMRNNCNNKCQQQDNQNKLAKY